MTTEIHAKYAAAREKYPDDIARIEEEEEQVKNLLRMREYANDEMTKRIMEMCRNDILACRRRLATDRDLVNAPEVQRDLWFIIDARLWFLGLVAKDFTTELQIIEAGLDAELMR